MRIFNFVAIAGTVTTAQYNDNASTGSELTDAIFKSLMFCHEWINNVSSFKTELIRERRWFRQ